MPTSTTIFLPLSLALLVGCWTPTQAQTSADTTTTPRATKKTKRPRYLRLSLGTIPDTYWTYSCLQVGLEYAPMLTKHVGVAGRLVGISGHPTSSDPAYGPWIDQIPNQNCRAGYAEVEALLYPIGVSHRVRFAVGLGGFAGYYRNNAYSSGIIVAGQANWYELATYQGHLVGYLGSLNLEVALGKQRRWALGAKLTRQKGGAASPTCRGITSRWPGNFEAPAAGNRCRSQLVFLSKKRYQKTARKTCVSGPFARVAKPSRIRPFFGGLC